MKKGFTLVEVIITVIVIGALALVVAFLLNVVKLQSNDARRFSDMNQIAKALELYYDQNAKYPGTLEELVPAGFLPAVPVPPTGTAQAFYTYVPLGGNTICTGYHLGAAMETNYRDTIKNDADAYPGVPCSLAITADFDGTAIDCQIGVMGEGAGKGNCYDIKM